MARYTLRQIEYFRAAADLGSFAAAAAELHVSATAIAAAITELERVLGAQLCIRRKAQGVELTPTGVYILQEIRKLLSAADDLEYSISPTIGSLRGPVAIGCYATIAPTVLPGLATGFQATYPDVQLSFTDGSTDELLEQLREGRLDLVLTYRLNLPDGLEEAELYKTAVHALFAADHPLASNNSVSLHSLAEEPLIMLDLAPGNRHTLDMLYDAGITPHVRHRTPNFELVRSIVARGLGYSLLVQKPQIDYSYEGRPVVAVPVSPEPAEVTAVLVWPSGARPSPRAQALIQYAQRMLGERFPD